MRVPDHPLVQEYPWKWYQVGERCFWHLCLACHQVTWLEARDSCGTCRPSGRKPLQTHPLTAIQDGRCANRHCKPRGDRCVWPRLQCRFQVGTLYLTQPPLELAASPSFCQLYLVNTLTRHLQIYSGIFSLLSCLYYKPRSHALSLYS